MLRTFQDNFRTSVKFQEFPDNWEPCIVYRCNVTLETYVDRNTEVVQFKLVGHFTERLQRVLGLCLFKAVLHTGTLAHLHVQSFTVN